MGSRMEIDAAKIIPDGDVPASKIDFLNGLDKAGATFLRGAGLLPERAQ